MILDNILNTEPSFILNLYLNLIMFNKRTKKNLPTLGQCLNRSTIDI